MNYVGKYLGPNKIESILVSSTTKTPSGLPIVRVIFKTHAWTIPAATVMLLATDKETDLQSLQDRKFAILIPRIISTIEEIDCTSLEMQSLLLKVAAQAEAKLGRALNFVWYHDDRRFAPGYQTQNDFSLSEAAEIIATIPPAAPTEAAVPEKPAQE